MAVVRWVVTGSYEETQAAPAVAWAAPGLPLAITETQTAAATFVPQQQKPILQAVNRASTF